MLRQPARTYLDPADVEDSGTERVVGNVRLLRAQPGSQLELPDRPSTLILALDDVADMRTGGSSLSRTL